MKESSAIIIGSTAMNLALGYSTATGNLLGDPIKDMMPEYSYLVFGSIMATPLGGFLHGITHDPEDSPINRTRRNSFSISQGTGGQVKYHSTSGESVRELSKLEIGLIEGVCSGVLSLAAYSVGFLAGKITN